MVLEIGSRKIETCLNEGSRVFKGNLRGSFKKVSIVFKIEGCFE